MRQVLRVIINELIDSLNWPLQLFPIPIEMVWKPSASASPH